MEECQKAAQSPFSGAQIGPLGIEIQGEPNSDNGKINCPSEEIGQNVLSLHRQNRTKRIVP
jgi:hypothetical protein